MGQRFRWEGCGAGRSQSDVQVNVWTSCAPGPGSAAGNDRSAGVSPILTSMSS
jgi:hypothetical protein